MKTSENIKNLSTALLQAQKNITFAGKNARNPHFKNTYADLTAVIDAIKTALNDAGIVFMQTPSPSENGTLALTTRLIHAETGEFMEDTGVCPLPKSDPQGYGSAMTYMRRYSLASICGLYQDDDDGEQARPKLDPNVLQKHLINIKNSQNLGNLKTVYVDAIRELKSDPLAMKSLELEKDKRKNELETLVE
jgi:hypothetical protein